MNNGYPSPNILYRINWERVLIIVLIVLVFVLGGVWFFGKTIDKDKINELHKQNEQIIKERKELAFQLDSMKTVELKIENDNKELEKRIESTDSLVRVLKGRRGSDNTKLDSVLAQLNRGKKEIEHLRSNPANRKNDALIESLRKKLNK